MPLLFCKSMSINDLYAKYPIIITDSRKAQPDSMFFALKGSAFDGNDFAAQALDSGCSCAVVDNPKVAIDERYILVDNVLKSLQDLARERRKQLDIPVIAITGSNGKTTTKELIKCVLETEYEVYATPDNFNNHIGVPLTILGIPSNAQIAIIEMGANHIGEIRTLCEIARPTCGLITNIGKAHLEGFGTLEGVKKAKKELYDYLNEHEGMIFYNEKNLILRPLLEEVKTKTIAYGRNCRGKLIASSPYLKVYLRIGENSHKVSTGMAGVYNLENIIAAVCVGKRFKVPEKQIIAAIKSYKPQNNRSQVFSAARNRLLLDFYNANPTSMNESLKNFFEQIEGDKMLILGDMFELGKHTKKEHAAIIDLLTTRNDVNSIVVVGKHFYEAAKDMSGIMAFSEIDDLKRWLTDNPPENMFILLKGSRGMKLEQLTELL